MKLFDVYPLFDITIKSGKNLYLWDDQGVEYLDFYGGHAVISIGHSHPHYVKNLKDQVEEIAFYSNSVKIPLQEKLANLLGELSGYEDYNLFLCNSGAEANENALKMASFHTNRPGLISFTGGFHGRTSLAVSLTDNSKIVAPSNETSHTKILPFDNMEILEEELKKEQTAGVIVEGIQGIGGIVESEKLQKVRELCTQYGTALILDEIQSGYGRTGKFFAHQYHNIKPDIITVAKGMGNGFPVGGVLLNPEFVASYGLLGTTFGGNYLACQASLSVLEVIKNENLMENAREKGDYLMDAIREMNICEVRGKGLMIGLEFPNPIADMRKKLLLEDKIFTGSAKNPHVLRLLPPLTLDFAACDHFINKLADRIKK